MGMMRRAAIGLGALAAVTLLAGVANAQESKSQSGLGFGVNAGFGLNPDEFVAGIQFTIGKPVGIFRMVPNAHIGFGSGTDVDIGWDFLAHFQASDSKFAFYAGASPTLTFDSDTNLGGTIVAGMQFPMIAKKATDLEARFGFAGAPNFRLLLVLTL
jgi:hypothetical protein